VFSSGCLWRASAGPPSVAVEPLYFFAVQQMVPPALFRGKPALLDELPDSDRRDAQNFSRIFGRNQIHRTRSF